MALLVDTFVPFGADGHVDHGAVRAHLLWLLAHGVDGVVLGSGEFLHLDRKEKEKLLEVAAGVLQGRTLIAPIWDTTPGHVGRLGRATAAVGGISLLPPPLLIPTPESALFEWFASVDAHLGTSVLAWHDPRFQNPLSDRLLARLAAETSIVGWLDGSIDLFRVRRQVAQWPGAGFAQIDGYDVADLEALSGLSGLRGGITRIGGAWPELARRCWTREEPQLDALVHRAAQTERAGGIAALKRHMGFGLRLPLIGVDEEAVSRLPPTGFPR